MQISPKSNVDFHRILGKTKDHLPRLYPSSVFLSQFYKHICIPETENLRQNKLIKKVAVSSASGLS